MVIFCCFFLPSPGYRFIFKHHSQSSSLSLSSLSLLLFSCTIKLLKQVQLLKQVLPQHLQNLVHDDCAFVQLHERHEYGVSVAQLH